MGNKTYKIKNKLLTKKSNKDEKNQSLSEINSGEKSLNNIIYIEYKVNEDQNKVRIFGDEFVKQNKERCKMFIKCRVYDIIDQICFEEYDIKKCDQTFEIIFEGKYITDMKNMFNECENLIKIDFSFFDTQNVTNMEGMFSDCKNLTKLDLSSFNTKNVTNMACMFWNCKNLININLSSFNTRKVNNIGYMFYGCWNLINLDLSNFNIEKVNHMEFMFYNCYNLANLDLSSFITQNEINTEVMFNYYVEGFVKINRKSFNKLKKRLDENQIIFIIEI